VLSGGFVPCPLAKRIDNTKTKAQVNLFITIVCYEIKTNK